MKPIPSKMESRPLIQWLPQDEYSQNILRERAERVARKAIISAQKRSDSSYISFRLGRDEHYGLSYEQVKEVMPPQNPTPLARAPRFIAGVINRRGALLAVLDLKQLFGIQPTDYSNLSILIVNSKKMTLGILADEVEGSFSYDPSLLDSPLPSEGTIKSEYILGVHQARTALLNVDAILTDIQTQLQGTF